MMYKSTLPMPYLGLNILFRFQAAISRTSRWTSEAFVNAEPRYSIVKEARTKGSRHQGETNAEANPNSSRASSRLISQSTSRSM